MKIVITSESIAQNKTYMTDKSDNLASTRLPICFTFVSATKTNDMSGKIYRDAEFARRTLHEFPRGDVRNEHNMQNKQWHLLDPLWFSAEQ